MKAVVGAQKYPTDSGFSSEARSGTTAAWCELRRDFARLGDAAFDARPARAIDLFQDSNLRNVSATTPASAQFCTEQLL